MQYPALVYRCPGSQQRPRGTYDCVGVADEQEHLAALKDGWFSSMPDAIEAERTGTQSDTKQVAELQARLQYIEDAKLAEAQATIDSIAADKKAREEAELQELQRQEDAEAADSKRKADEAEAKKKTDAEAQSSKGTGTLHAKGK